MQGYSMDQSAALELPRSTGPATPFCSVPAWLLTTMLNFLKAVTTNLHRTRNTPNPPIEALLLPLCQTRITSLKTLRSALLPHTLCPYLFLLLCFWALICDQPPLFWCSLRFLASKYSWHRKKFFATRLFFVCSKSDWHAACCMCREFRGLLGKSRRCHLSHNTPQLVHVP